MVGLVKMVSQVCLVHKESLVYKAKEEKRDQRVILVVKGLTASQGSQERLAQQVKLDQLVPVVRQVQLAAEV